MKKQFDQEKCNKHIINPNYVFKQYGPDEFLVYEYN